LDHQDPACALFVKTKPKGEGRWQGRVFFSWSCGNRRYVKIASLGLTP
jgi:hypothetical protein